MNTRNRREIEQGLESKGFELDDSGRDHRFFLYYSLSGKKTSVRTKTSRGSQYRELSDGLISEMARQCRIRKSEFMALIECTLDREEYETLLQNALGNTHPPPF